FELLRQISERQDRVRDLEETARSRPLTPEERDELMRLRRRLDSDESFLQTLIQLQRAYGINSYL
ncbi:MAG: hypothetical protein NZM37_11385, partial [Sandaracinaceae bacterium]|nr:hypothetical protein [Sandaracinaceae bacterium]